MSPVSEMRLDFIFAKEHSLKSADVIQSLASTIESAPTYSDAVAALLARRDALVDCVDTTSLERGVINFYLHCFSEKSEEE